MRLFVVLMCVLFLAGCSGTPKQSRLQSTESLEKPPEMAIKDPIKEDAKENAITGDEKPRRKGLNSDVYLVEDSNTELKIKRNFDEAWTLLGQAIRVNNLKAIAKKNQGVYIVSYKSGGIFGEFNIFGTSNDLTYACKVETVENETKVSVKFADGNEKLDTSSLKDGVSDYSYDSSSKLLKLIYETLLNEVQ
ncbi:hypothetical protein [Methyloglobulus sp.]|uniref:hypothetical protein n=1 Tax=Methyloglobulus sp. TaxID=2518622 RepID=UPI0032B86863